MATKNQITGMRGVYLVAAELSKHGFIASPTSRSARGVDILATDAECKQAFSIQVKTNAGKYRYWLLSKESKNMTSDSHVYVFVKIKPKEQSAEFFIVPSKIVAEKMNTIEFPRSTIYSFYYKDAISYKERWDILGVDVSNF